MAEAIGIAPNIIISAGHAGQVIQGCQSITAWVRKFRNVPKDIQHLIQELNSIEESTKITAMMRINIVRREVELQLDAALQQCLDAVQELRKKSVDADILFEVRSQSKKARGWQRPKVMLGKQSVQISVKRLSRAKAQLVVVQSNVLLQCQQEQLRDVNESLSLSLRTLQNSASIMDCVNNTTKGLYSQAEETALAVTSLSTDVKQYLEDMPDMVTPLERTMETVLLKHAYQTSNSHGGHAKKEPAQCIKIKMAENNLPHQELSAALLSPHYQSCRMSREPSQKPRLDITGQFPGSILQLERGHTHES